MSRTRGGASQDDSRQRPTSLVCRGDYKQTHDYTVIDVMDGHEDRHDHQGRKLEELQTFLC